MNKKLIIVLILISTVAILSGCIGNTSDTPKVQDPQVSNTMVLIKKENIKSTFDQTITVIHDDKYNVTCWTNWEMAHGGISCIPDSQLNK